MPLFYFVNDSTNTLFLDNKYNPLRKHILILQSGHLFTHSWQRINLSIWVGQHIVRLSVRCNEWDSTQVGQHIIRLSVRCNEWYSTQVGQHTVCLSVHCTGTAQLAAIEMHGKICRSLPQAPEEFNFCTIDYTSAAIYHSMVYLQL